MSSASYLEKLLDGVGVEWKPLGDVTTSISAGGDLPKKYLKGQAKPTEEFPYPIYSNGIDEKSIYGYTDSYRVDSEAVTISARGTIGWHTIRQAKFTPIVRLIVLIPNTGIVTSKFLNYILEITEIGHSGGSIPQLTVPNVKKIKIPVPCPKNPKKSLAIQAEIVRILDAFTSLTAELTARKKQYNYYRNQLLTFSGCEVDWKPLGDVLPMRAGQHISATKIMPEASDEFYYPCFGGNGIRGFVSHKSHDGEHLLIGRQGALCGNVQRMKGKFYATEHAVVVTATNQVNIDFAFHVLTVMNLNQYASQSAQPGLAVGKLENLKFPIPYAENPKKSLAEQARIAAILDKFDTLTNSLQEGLPREIELRQKQYEYYRDLLLNFPKEKEAILT